MDAITSGKYMSCFKVLSYVIGIYFSHTYPSIMALVLKRSKK